MSVGRPKWLLSLAMTSLSPKVITSCEPLPMNLTIWLAQSSTTQTCRSGSYGSTVTL